MGWLNNMKKWIYDATTKFIDVTTSSDGIEEKKAVDIPTALKNNGVIVPCCALLQRFLNAELGIDMAGIVPDGLILNNEKRIVNLYVLLKYIDISTLTVDDGTGVSVSVESYILNHFRIENWSDFIDAIFKKLRETVYSSQDEDKYILMTCDEECNELICALAVIIGSNPNCMKIPIGDSSTITVEFDGWHLWDMLDSIGELLEAEGLIADKTQVQHNIAFAQRFNYGVGTCVDTTDPDDPVFTTEVECNLVIHKFPSSHIGYGTGQYSTSYTGEFPYGNGENVWYWEIFVTQATVGQIAEIEYGTPSVARSLNAGNIYGQTGNNSWYYGTGYSDVTFYNEQHNVITARIYKSWLIRSMRYYVEGYTGNLLSQTTFYTDYRPSEGDNSIYFEHNPSNRYFYQNTPYPFYGATYGTQGTEEIETPMVGNSGSVVTEETFKAPAIDSTTEGDLQDNNVKLISSDTTNLFIYIGQKLANMIKGFLPTTTPFDTTHALKVATYKKSTKKLIDTDTKVTAFTKTNSAVWLPLWKNKLTIDELEEPSCIGLSTQYYLNSTQLNLLASDLWDGDWFSAIFDRDPMESILDLFALPFTLIRNEDYLSDALKKNVVNIAVYDDCSVPIMYGKDTHYGRGYMLNKKRVKIGFKLDPIELNNNFTDYAPYTKASIWIPFLGKREIDTSLIIKQKLELIYFISLNTGDFEVQLISKNPTSDTYEDIGNATFEDYPTEETETETLENGDALHYVYNQAPILVEFGNMAYPMNVSGKYKNSSDVLAHIAQGVASAISMKTSDTGGTGLANAVLGLVGDIKGNAVKSTSLANKDKWLGHARPYITLFYHQTIDDMEVGTAFDEVVGHKSSHGLRIGDMTKGYHKLKAVKMEGLLCTKTEQEMIKNLLMNGFYKGVKAKTKVD